MYVSPHISSFRERITINGEMISEEDVVKNLQLINEIEPTLPTSLSFFESVTGMAFNYFREKQVDVAVIEVGLGGRLDSTNIITRTECDYIHWTRSPGHFGKHHY